MSITTKETFESFSDNCTNKEMEFDSNDSFCSWSEKEECSYDNCPRIRAWEQGVQG